MNAYSRPQLVSQGQLKQADEVRRKVEQDIAFLCDRIAALEAQSRPNRPVIETYRTMLASRQSVLKWLQDGELRHQAPRARAL
ncbi:hypothetical protein [Marinimicrobium koreense]|uniref:Uncharacterized protein n=1 Tax=Marinimicrobium koreense TaxID=306545 RepID=A0A3N1P856_9GAMM|nr:hypothetical protein [Marinimicrobium koreense]ROQ20906.1 hypothetical protein EDC38_1524 [Marinimicrobium koreense]